MNSFLDRDTGAKSRGKFISLAGYERVRNLMAGRQYTIAINLAPERLLYAGPLIPGAWTHARDEEKGAAVGGEILIDTGAFGAMIDVEVAERLRLPIRGTKEIHGIHGYGTVSCYQGTLVLAAKDPIGEDCKFIKVIECIGVPSLTEKNREHGVNVIGIIGRQFLQNVHLEIDGASGKLKLLVDD
jgi:predicted aspartyl protease